MSNSSDRYFSQSGLIKLQDGKQYRHQLYEETQRILTNLLDVLPSVYTATTPSTNYGEHLKRVAVELARLNIEAQNIQKDASLDTVRPEYLYQKFGYQLQVGNTFFPTSYFSDEDYRRFLQAVLKVIFNGATKENIAEALTLFAKHPIIVKDFTTQRGIIQYSYQEKFNSEGYLNLLGTPSNIDVKTIKISNDSTLYTSADYYITNSDRPNEIVRLKLQQPSRISSSSFIKVEYEYQDPIFEQFKLKIYFNQDEVKYPNRSDDILQKIKFLLQLIKPAHVLADVRVYQADQLPKEFAGFSPSALEEEELYIALDEVVLQKFNSNQYDDFRRFTRNPSDTQVIEFNNSGTVMNKISERYNDVGFYFNEPDPLYRKKYSLYQMKGISSQSSSLFNSPYNLEFNKEQTNILSNVSSFDQEASSYQVLWPAVSPNVDLPNRDFVADPEQVKVSSLTLDFGVKVTAGKLYSYVKSGIYNVESDIEVLLPEEAKGKRVYIYIDLQNLIAPSIEYFISTGLYLDITTPHIPLAQIDIPPGASLVWDHYIRDLRIFNFINFTLAGDTSGFSEFQVSHGTVLGAGTRPIQFKFDDNQTNVVYKTENLNELNSTNFTLNGSFVVGIDHIGYTADDTHFVFSNLEANVLSSPEGSIAAPLFEGDFVLGFVFGGTNGEESVHIFTEDTTFIFNDTLGGHESFVYSASSLELLSANVLWESLVILNATTGVILSPNSHYTFNESTNEITIQGSAPVSVGDLLVCRFYREFGTLLNQDLLYASNSTYATFDFNVINADSVSDIDETSSAISVSHKNYEFFGVPVTGVIFNDAVLVTGTVTVYGFPEGTALILNDFTSLLNQPAEEYLVPVVLFDEASPSLLNETPLGPIEQLALESVSIIDQATGLPVIAFDGLPVT